MVLKRKRKSTSDARGKLKRRRAGSRRGARPQKEEERMLYVGPGGTQREVGTGAGAMARIGRAVPGVMAWGQRRLVGLAGAVGAAGTWTVLRAGPALAQVTLTPDSSQGPGGAQLQQLVNWGAGMGLILCVAAVVLHAVRWGLGSQQHNMARV